VSIAGIGNEVNCSIICYALPLELTFFTTLRDYLILKMPKRKYSFNDKLQSKYPLVKQRSDPSDVTCEKCQTDFSVAHSDAGDIEKHLRSEKHKLSDYASASSSSMFNF
jgi:hypothetical protein